MEERVSNLTQIFWRAAVMLTVLAILMSCESLTAQPPAGSSPTQEAAAPEPPPTFQSQHLNPLDTPRTYVEESCKYLKNRWNPLNAAPGTVVMVIAFPEITNSPTNNTLALIDLQRTMQELSVQGFKAINTWEFLSFMERNVRIPERSVLLIQDGNHPADYYSRFFGETWKNRGWPVVGAWVSSADVSRDEWEAQMALEREGFVDHQAMGISADIRISDESSKTIITRELDGSRHAFAENFAKDPYAFIWPNNGFGLRPIRAARLLGYQLGFTSNSRGPVMYNWVPLADEIDPERPQYVPEGLINDPLMTLPRYSAFEALEAVDVVRTTGKEAAAYAEANREAEVAYYEQVCKAEYGPLPTP